MSRLKWEFGYWRSVACLAVYIAAGNAEVRNRLRKGPEKNKVMDGEKERSRASEENHGCLEMRLFCQKWERGLHHHGWQSCPAQSCACLSKWGRERGAPTQTSLSNSLSSSVITVLSLSPCLSSRFPDVSTKTPVWSKGHREPLICLRNSSQPTLCLHRIYF